MAIKRKGISMANYEISKELNINPGQCSKRLVILERERILHSDNGYPKFYSFNGNNMAQNFIILTVECPKCQQVHLIHHTQSTVQCDCFTASGRKTRFYVFQDRVKDMRFLFKNSNSEKSSASESQHLNQFKGAS